MTQSLDSINPFGLEGRIEVGNKLNEGVLVDLQADVQHSPDLVGSINNELEINVEIIGTGPRGLPGKDGSGYVHPETHSANMIEETVDKVFVSESERNMIPGYIHDQIAALDTWVINHELDKYPSVSIVDSGSNVVYGSVYYISRNQIIVSFTVAFSGRAYLN